MFSSALRASLVLALALPALACSAPLDSDVTSSEAAIGTAISSSPHYKPSAELRALLAPVVEAGVLDAASWSTLAPHLASLPKRESADARAMVVLLTERTFRLDAAVRAELVTLATSWGYRVEGRTKVEEILATSITEADTELARLAPLARVTDGTVVLGVVDGGFDWRHPALVSHFLVNPGEIPENHLDDDGNGHVDDVHGLGHHDADVDYESTFSNTAHGTHVAGIAASGSEAVKLVGAVAYNPSLAQRAFEYLAGRGARVVNMSQSHWSDIPATLAVIDRHPDVLFVVSAGNYGKELGVGDHTPEQSLAANNRPNLLKIAAANEDGTKEVDTCFSATLADLGASVPFASATPGTSYVYRVKTSQAAPLVANTAAKMRLLSPSLTPAAVAELLRRTVTTSPEWKPLTRAGGLLAPTRALRAAAVVALRAQGLSVSAAAAKITSDDAERRALVAAVDALEL